MNLGGYTEAESFSPYSRYDTTTAPTVNDDIADGYTPGSMRVDISGEHAYLCLNSGSGVAVWKPLTFVLSAGVPDPYIPVDGDMNITGDVSASQDVSGATATVAGAITAASLALTYVGAADALAVDLGTELGSQAIVVAEDNVIRTPAMLQLTRQAAATGPVIDVTPGGASAALMVRGGIIDLSIAGDGAERFISGADAALTVFANDVALCTWNGQLGNVRTQIFQRMSFNAGVSMSLGSALNTRSELIFDTGQTTDCTVFGLDNTSRNLILCDAADAPQGSVDFAHAASPDAKLIWQGADGTDVTEFGSATYVSATQLFTFATGAGDLRLAPAANVSLAGKLLDLSVAGDGAEYIYSDLDDSVRIYANSTAIAQFDGTTGNSKIKLNVRLELPGERELRFGSGTGAAASSFEYDTNQTVDCLLLGLNTNSHNLVLCSRDDMATDWTHVASDDAKLIWQGSDSTDVTEYGSATYVSATQLFTFATGAGDLRLAPAGNVSLAGKILDLSIAGDGGETIHSNADDGIRLTAGGGVALDVKKLAIQANIQVVLPATRVLTFGSGSTTVASSMVYTTGQTLDCLVLGLNDSSRNMVLCERTDLLTNWGHAISADAKLILQGSDATDITEFGSATYISATQLFTFSTGAGNFSFTPTGTEALRIEDEATLGATETSLWLYDDDNAQMEQVTVGAADTGGAGFKVLRIAN